MWGYMASSFEKATNPSQYDEETVYWEKIGLSETPTRKFFLEKITSSLGDVRGKDILDVGSGTGWLLEEMRRAGAHDVLGIEPSVKNVELARKYHPDIPIKQASLESFEEEGKKWDVILAVMIFPHIRDADEAMKKVASLLNDDGVLVLITPNYEYMRTPRFDYEIEIEDVNEEEFSVQTKRPWGMVYDIVRKPDVYVKAAEVQGLRKVTVEPISPTPELIEAEPKYEQFEHRGIADLLMFRKATDVDNRD